MGVETRTEIDVQTVGAVRHVEHGDALASGSHPSFMAGGDRHVQRATVKALCQSLGWFLPPGRQVRHLAAPGRRKPSTERSTMLSCRKFSLDSDNDYPPDMIGNAVGDAIAILRTLSKAMCNGPMSHCDADFYQCLHVAMARLEAALEAEALLHAHFTITEKEACEGAS